MQASDERIIEGLAAALAIHPSWPAPRRLNVFALSADDARQALAEAYGADARALTVLFRSEVLAALRATAGKEGFWVAGAEGPEEFVEAPGESEAMRDYEARFGVKAASCASRDLVAQELARMDDALSGADPQRLASRAFLAMVAGSGRTA